MNYAQFDRYVDDHAGEFLARLQALCRIPSVAAEGGPAMAEAAGQVLALCRDVGLDAQLVPTGGAPVVLAQGGRGPCGLLVYNHYDVQPPDPLDAWSVPPFAAEIRDGFLYARGVADNKGNLVARLCALEAYRAVFGEPQLRLCFVLEGEEEVGSPHLAAFAADHAGLLRSLDGCVWESGYKDEAERPVVELGLKGVLAVELHVRTALSDAHSGYGGLYPNAIWRLVEALSTLRTPDGTVTVDGLGDHVRAPSPAEERVIEAIPFDATAVQRSLGLRSFLGGLTGTAALRRLMFEPTCTVNGIWGGYTGPGSKTVIPAQAWAKLDFRLVPDLTPELTLQLLRQHLKRRGFDDVEVVDTEDGLLPARTDPEAPVVKTALAALADVYGVPPVVHPTSPGSGPMYQLCQAYGIPAVSFGVGWWGSHVHAADENIRVADYLAGIKVMGRMIGMYAED